MFIFRHSSSSFSRPRAHECGEVVVSLFFVLHFRPISSFCGSALQHYSDVNSSSRCSQIAQSINSPIGNDSRIFMWQYVRLVLSCGAPSTQLHRQFLWKLHAKHFNSYMYDAQPDLDAFCRLRHRLSGLYIVHTYGCIFHAVTSTKRIQSKSKFI